MYKEIQEVGDNFELTQIHLLPRWKIINKFQEVVVQNRNFEGLMNVLLGMVYKAEIKSNCVCVCAGDGQGDEGGQQWVWGVGQGLGVSGKAWEGPDKWIHGA